MAHLQPKCKMQRFNLKQTESSLTRPGVKVDFHQSKSNVNLAVTETVYGALQSIEVLQCMLGCLQVEADDNWHVIFGQVKDDVFKV